MRLHSLLPADRTRLGVVQLEDDLGVILLGPFPAYGKADSVAAIQHGNPTRNPLFPFGDHPLGEYVVASVVANQPGFGPWFFGLRPTGGQALESVRQGLRHGLGMHAGILRLDGTLRPTYGCLRVHDYVAIAFQKVVPVGLPYLCEAA